VGGHRLIADENDPNLLFQMIDKLGDSGEKEAAGIIIAAMNRLGKKRHQVNIHTYMSCYVALGKLKDVRAIKPMADTFDIVKGIRHATSCLFYNIGEIGGRQAVVSLAKIVDNYKCDNYNRVPYDLENALKKLTGLDCKCKRYCWEKWLENN
jgi:hypothetical protein